MVDRDGLGILVVIFTMHLARRDYVYDAEEAANYVVISPVFWTLALCWLIFACYTNHGGILNRFLSNYWLLLFSRISYAVYLTQFAVFFYNVGTTRHSSEFHLHRGLDLLEAATVIIISIILTLFFDIPMQEIKNVLMESTDSLNAEVAISEKSAIVESSTSEISKTSKAPKSELHEKKIFEEDEVASTGWDWQRDIVDGGAKYSNESIEDEERVDMPILKKSSGRRRSFTNQYIHTWIFNSNTTIKFSSTCYSRLTAVNDQLQVVHFCLHQEALGTPEILKH